MSCLFGRERQSSHFTTDILTRVSRAEFLTNRKKYLAATDTETGPTVRSHSSKEHLYISGPSVEVKKSYVLWRRT